MGTLLLWLVLATTAASQGGVIGGGVNGLPQAPPRDPRVKPVVGTGAISGRVTAADTGAPIRRAVVNLNGGQQSRATYTDHEGRFSFANLPPGSYSVFVNPGMHRAGYQTLAYGMPQSSSGLMYRPRPIELADGQKVENVDLALPRTGVITGRVTDPYGEPASRVQVGAWLLRPGSEPSQNSGAQTDDLGQFRLFGLPPGDYIVMATPQSGGMPTEVEGEPMGFAPTYAPGTPVRADAMRVRVARGGEASADIRLTETRVYSITGTVVTSKGDSTQNTNVMLMRSDIGFGGSTMGASVTPTGSFTIRNVPPGDYEVVARYMPPRESGTVIRGPDPNQEYASVKVSVGTADVDGVVLAMKPGAVVTGEIVFDQAPPEGQRVSLFAQTVEQQRFMSTPNVEVKGATFTMRSVFGPLLLRGTVAGPPGWGLKAVLLRGKDITDEPTLFTASDSGHLQVVFTATAPSIEGVVTDDAGKPVTEATIVLFGEDRSTWKGRTSSYFRTGRVIKDGRFTVMGLREGHYYAAALPAELGMSLGQPTEEFFQALSKVATRVTLNAGEKRTVDLPLIRMQEQ